MREYIFSQQSIRLGFKGSLIFLGWLLIFGPGISLLGKALSHPGNNQVNHVQAKKGAVSALPDFFPREDAPKGTRTRLDLGGGWKFRRLGRQEWWPARVPGCVHLDLLAQGLIPDPFYRNNENKVQWIEKEDWEYEHDFNFSRNINQREKIELVFEGLDTLATIFLNGKQIGQTDNMFRCYRFEVTKIIKRGRNNLRVLFASPVKRQQELARRQSYQLPGNAPHLRKAAYQFGWDWGPRLVASGIWRPVYLEIWSGARIQSFNWITKSLAEDEVKAELEIEIIGQQEFSGWLEVRLQGNQELTFRFPLRLKPGWNQRRFPLNIPHPQLWWPRGMGKPYLYQLELTLGRENRVLDQLKRKIGLRILCLVREQDKWGHSFYFEINGRPLFARGANWIPADSFPPRVTAEKYRQLLTACVEANFNFLRVWGGGIYEDDYFYDLCDELGLLVWQDFMFACTLVPGDEDFVTNVRLEAEDQVRRLRYHPCLALWCGNNESEEGWFHWGWKENLPSQVGEDYQQIFHHLLPTVVRKLDPERPYWPSSPHSELIGQPRSELSGDGHYWGVWHGQEPFSSYLEVNSRFLSEFGFQSFPPWQTIKIFSQPDDWNVASPVIEQHQKHPIGNKLILSYLIDHFRLPSDFANLVWLSQVLQAEGMKLGVEHWRSNRPRTMGTLYWQLNDCWPVISWSSLDYYGRWKALHYFARRFFSPLLVAIIKRKADLIVYGISDLGHHWSGRLVLQLLAYSGELIWKEEKLVTIPSDKSLELWRKSREKILTNFSPEDVYLVAELIPQDRQLKNDVKKEVSQSDQASMIYGPDYSRNIYHFSPLKRIELPQPQLSVKSRQVGHHLLIEISTDKLAKYVYLEAENIEGRFSDNFFDLLPGESKIVLFYPRNPRTLSEFEKSLRILSLRDTY